MKSPKHKLVYFLVCFLVGFAYKTEGQTYFKVDADSVRLLQGELILKNKTRNIPGVLLNTGDGITHFEILKLGAIGDSALAILGQDTLNMVAFGAGDVRGKYYILSQDIPLMPGYYYHPRAFESALDSGNAYRVHALIGFETTYPFDTTTFLRLQYSDTTVKVRASLFSTLKSDVGIHKYLLKYDKVIRSTVKNDVIRLSFFTGLNDQSGNMRLDSMSYMHTELINPAEYSPD